MRTYLRFSSSSSAIVFSIWCFRVSASRALMPASYHRRSTACIVSLRVFGAGASVDLRAGLTRPHVRFTGRSPQYSLSPLAGVPFARQLVALGSVRELGHVHLCDLLQGVAD